MAKGMELDVKKLQNNYPTEFQSTNILILRFGIISALIELEKILFYGVKRP